MNRAVEIFPPLLLGSLLCCASVGAAGGGDDLAAAHPAGVRNTSRRPCSIPNAGEGCVHAD